MVAYASEPAGPGVGTAWLGAAERPVRLGKKRVVEYGFPHLHGPVGEIAVYLLPGAVVLYRAPGLRDVPDVVVEIAYREDPAGAGGSARGAPAGGPAPGDPVSG